VRQPAGARAAGAAIAVLVVLAAACSRGGDDPTLNGDVPDVETSDTTSSTSSSITSTTVGAACPAVERVRNREGLVEQSADVDGDRAADVVQSFPDGDHVTLLVDLAAGGGATARLRPSEDVPVALVGAAVLERLDGRDVLWVRVSAGASTTVLGLYHLEGCSLEAATFQNGEPVELPIGGTVGTASGARCGSLMDPEADLLVYEATLIDEHEYEIVTTEYRWQDGQLVLSPEGAPTVARSDDPSAAAGFECGGVAL
jgi:hypothetical protein